PHSLIDLHLGAVVVRATARSRALHGDRRNVAVTESATTDIRVRIIQIVPGGHQIRVLPDRVASLDATRLLQGRPQCSGLPQPTWTQLETDERCEGVLGRATGGPMSTGGLGQRIGLRKP